MAGRDAISTEVQPPVGPRKYWTRRAISDCLVARLREDIGVNVRKAGSQTVEHVHPHVIPRYFGDVPDPRGGIRWVVPSKARYWIEQ